MQLEGGGHACNCPSIRKPPVRRQTRGRLAPSELAADQGRSKFVGSPLRRSPSRVQVQVHTQAHLRRLLSVAIEVPSIHLKDLSDRAGNQVRLHTCTAHRSQPEATTWDKPTKPTKPTKATLS